MVRVSVVVPHWNRRERLLPLLKQLRAQTHPIEEVIIVDDGSSDGSPEVAESLGARVIRMSSRSGFARAVNRGLSESTGDYVAVVNNDVDLDPYWLEHLAQALRPADVWFTTGKTLSSTSGLLDGTFDLVCRGSCAWRAGSGMPQSSEFERQRSIDMAPWTAVLIKSKLFQRIRMLDESFGSYLEDVEFGLRCSLAGLRGIYVPEAIAWHEGSGTLGRWSGETVRQISRNQVLLIARHYPSGWIWRYGWPVLVAHCLWGLVALRRGCGMAWLRGKWEGMRIFAAERGPGAAPNELHRVLSHGETTIRDLQTRHGSDWYWRWYFRLT